MPLSKQELAVLRQINKNRFEDMRRPRVNRAKAFFAGLFAFGCAAAVVFCYIDLPPAVFFASFIAGVAFAFLWWLRQRVRLWSLWVRIIDWEEVDQLLAEHGEVPPVATLQAARLDGRDASEPTAIQAGPATDIQHPPSRPRRREAVPDDDDDD
jgi:hypothetical protein